MGEPLPGFDIVVLETPYGIATNAEGNYFILKLPQGKRDVEARLISYGKVRTTDVQLRTNGTTIMDFVLSVKAIQGETVAVTINTTAVKIR
ncbi:MAG: carboxypeptidase-like regulatory domain-containing protein [candidate division KSB1 bacterium]|nr:carboxypeptidase-like regulatory domain-containing protein [candidate division KSB1 bacterium]MDZ7345423.1 carboxypeptidase-like regulatory domain-containing protein [candidate division KSB1 bacterium]